METVHGGQFERHVAEIRELGADVKLVETVTEARGMRRSEIEIKVKVDIREVRADIGPNPTRKAAEDT